MQRLDSSFLRSIKGQVPFHKMEKVLTFAPALIQTWNHRNHRISEKTVNGLFKTLHATSVISSVIVRCSGLGQDEELSSPASNALAHRRECSSRT